MKYAMNGFIRLLLISQTLLLLSLTGCREKAEVPSDTPPSPSPGVLVNREDGTTNPQVRGNPPTAEEKEPKVPVITAKEIFTLYSENTPKADDFYQGKTLRVSGLVEEPFLERIIGTPAVMIGQADRTQGVVPNLECLMAPGEESSLAGLWRRQQIIIEGQCSDYVKGVVVFANCRIIEAGPAIASTDATAAGLLAELADNEPAFLQKYVGKVLVVDGIVAAIDIQLRHILIKGKTPQPGRPHYLRVDFLPSEITMMQQFQPDSPIRVKGECGDMDADGNIPLFHARVVQ